MADRNYSKNFVGLVQVCRGMVKKRDKDSSSPSTIKNHVEGHNPIILLWGDVFSCGAAELSASRVYFGLFFIS